MIVNQGDIHLVNLNPIKGHEQGGYRPVLIIQGDVANKYLNTVIVVPLTSNLEAKYKKGTYFISKEVSGLNFDSIALIFQIRTIDKRRLGKWVSKISKKDSFNVINNLIELL